MSLWWYILAWLLTFDEFGIGLKMVHVVPKNFPHVGILLGHYIRGIKLLFNYFTEYKVQSIKGNQIVVQQLFNPSLSKFKNGLNTFETHYRWNLRWFNYNYWDVQHARILFLCEVWSFFLFLEIAYVNCKSFRFHIQQM